MIANKQYVPILKGKMGEFSALAELSSEIKSNVVPIIDVVPKPINKNIEKHLKDTVNYFKKYWNKESKIYIDNYMIQDEGFLSSGEHINEYVFNELRNENMNVVPVINNVTGVEYNEKIKGIINAENKGVGIRIFRKAFNDMKEELQYILSFLEIDYSEADLVLDMRSLTDLTVAELYELSINLIQEIPGLSKWRSFVLSGGNFPIDLTEIMPDQVYPLPRKEWELWRKITENKEIERIPTYSDYAISHPKISNFDSEFPNASASIRYTHLEDFYIYRGKGTRQHGFEQFFDISLALINSQEYFGRDHCLGDEFIYKCATERKKKGRLMDWRRVCTNHHITVVVDQLRQFWRDFNAARTS